MSDPLSLVRQAIAAGESLTLVDGAYTLRGVQFPADTRTAFKRSLGVDEHYHTLREIIFCFHNAGLSLVDYRKNCLQEKLKALVESDRAVLLAYLQGEITTCPQIDQQMVDSFVPPTATSTRTKRKAEEMLATDTNALPNDAGAADNTDAEKLNKLRAKFFPLYASKSSIYNISGKEDFRSVLKIFNNAVLARSSESSDANNNSNNANASNTSSNTNNNARTATRQTQKPIIIVPSAITSTINMFNAKLFLEEGKYVKPEECMQRGVEKKKVDVVIRRVSNNSKNNNMNNNDNNHNTRVLLYKLIDDPTMLPPEEWERVCAVFVTGQTWQFSRWKESDPVLLFQQVMATHLTLEGRPIDAKVQNWNCRVLKVDEFKDYVNAGVASQFWQFLDDFIMRKKPHLIASTASAAPPS